MRLFSIIILAFILTNCRQPKSLTEQFCECFSKNTSTQFGKKVSECNPNKESESLDTELTIDAIATCDKFFDQVTQLQIEQLKKRATQELEGLAELDTLNTIQVLMKNMNELILLDDFDSLIIITGKLKVIDSTNIAARFVKAYAHEQLNQIDIATTELQELNELSGTTNYNLSIILVKRRRNN